MRTCTTLTIACGLLVITGGCAKDPRPKYERPKLAAGEYATIAPTMGVWSGTKTEVDEVDGARVAGFMETYDVRVSPGEHTIGVVARRGGHSPGKSLYRFKHSFEAGHVYEVGFDSAGGLNASWRPILRDKTSKKTFFIDEEPLKVPR